MKNERQKRQVRWTLRLVLSSAIVMACILGLVDSVDEAAFAAGSGALRGMSWVIVNDTVMGGRSSAALTWNEANHLVWNGNLSLENNGGFVSIRSRDTGSDWSAYDGVEVVLAGAGRDVQVTAQRGDMVVRAGGYRAMVPTKVTGDTKVFIPWGAKTKPRSILTARSGPEPLETRDPAPTSVFITSGGALDVVRTVPDPAGIEAARTSRPSGRG